MWDTLRIVKDDKDHPLLFVEDRVCPQIRKDPNYGVFAFVAFGLCKHIFNCDIQIFLRGDEGRFVKTHCKMRTLY